jgi:hypothetical protein
MQEVPFCPPLGGFVNAMAQLLKIHCHRSFPGLVGVREKSLGAFARDRLPGLEKTRPEQGSDTLWSR